MWSEYCVGETTNRSIDVCVCRSVISCSDPPQIAAPLRLALKAAMSSLAPSSSEDRRHPGTSSPPPEPSASVGSVASIEVSVASLPRDLQELVRRIQEEQINIRARMKCHSGVL
jgi:hypothetical protein